MQDLEEIHNCDKGLDRKSDDDGERRYDRQSEKKDFNLADDGRDAAWASRQDKEGV